MRPILVAVLALSGLTAVAGPPDPAAVAAQVDRLLDARYAELGVTPAPPCSDEDFLRRAAFDLAGRPPKPDGVVKFLAWKEPAKRAEAVGLLLEGDEWAANQARYWRDVIFQRATNGRAQLAESTFEDWLAGRLAGGAGWDEIATDLLTATGDIRENGATGLIFAHDGDPAELAGEVSRVFLGVQIGCANCHDHPYDKWTRDDFHALAAYFPRVRVRRIPTPPPTAEIVSFDFARAANAELFRRNPEFVFRRFDKDGDGKITRPESAGTDIGRAFAAMLLYGDKDGDGAISLDEMKTLRPPSQGRNEKMEYFKPDLSDPASEGTLVRPALFATGAKTEIGTADVVRRRALAAAITDPGNPWFARAVVNRVWNELVGSGFYMPVDDLGPGREAVCPDVLELLCDGFVASGHDLKWLLATVANTQAYQRSLGTGSADAAPFAAASPTRLRGDQVYSALIQIVGEPSPSRFPMLERLGAGRRPNLTPRQQVAELFGTDPSTPLGEVTGDVPQSLFLMNGPLVQGRMKATGGPLGEIVNASDDPAEVVDRLYLLALSRRPTADDRKRALAYVAAAPSRREAYEDLLWAIVNSAEFVTRR